MPYSDLHSSPGGGGLTTAFSETIPEWAKNTAIYWGQGDIDDAEFINFIQFLIDRELITVPEPEIIDELEMEIEELKSSIAADVRNAYQDGYDAGYGDASSNKVASPRPDNAGSKVVASNDVVTITPVEGSSVPGCEGTGNGCYVPDPAVVRLGDTVILSNTDSAAHTFTAGTIADGPSGEFDTGLLAPGSSFEYKPDRTGEINHYCLVHPWMKGTIVVK